MYFSSLKLAVALVCVGASLILGAHWFGFIPDSTPITVRARNTLSEAIFDEASKVDAMQVPIMLNRQLWGEAELYFQQSHTTIFARIMHDPLVRLLSFIAIFGLIAYTVFVVRILRVFNSTQVVPERVRGALDTLAEGLLVLDENGKIVLANRAFADIVDESPDELANQQASDLGWVAEDVADDDYPWTLAIDKSQLQSERILRYQLKNGSQRIFSVNAAPLGKEHSQRGALATFRDVTHVEEHRAELERMLSLLRNSRDEIKRKNGELEILATQDALTGCLNRRAFFETFESLWSESKAIGTPLACLMIDIDHFKSVNDTYGHHAGDEVLRQVSQTIQRNYKDIGIVCRYGGEEFCILLPQVDLSQAVVEAEKTRQAITEIRLLDPAELRLSGSIGVSELRFDPADPQDLINQADTCLYVAKRAGRNRVIAFNANIANERHGERVQQAELDRIVIPYQAVTALVTTLSYRDANTAEHSRRVADLCARISDGILDPTQTYVLEIAALLHDIGKIGVPDEVLLKPGPLTRDEWELMGRHDRIGAEIISSAFGCKALSDIVSNHNAYYGGSGRDPHLPKGEDIPLGARLLSIADGYDAMVSDRVYRKSRSHTEAIEELRRCAGTQFDPKLVEHFAEKVESQSSEFAAGALSIRKQTAIQIGYQVERLAEAVACRDVQGLKTLASHLGLIARNSEIDAIAIAAERIEAEASEEELHWLSLLRDTHNLLDICRSTQSEFLRQSLESEAQRVNQ